MNDSWKTRPVTPKPKDSDGPPGWYSRGYIPHFDGGPVTQTLVLRLFDSLPQTVVERWKEELSRKPEKEAELELRRRVDAYLDKGTGSAFMKRPEIADKVQESILHFDGERYQLHAWIVMPNHVHVLMTPEPEFELGDILHSWKSYSANQCNKLLGRTGPFWQKEGFDRAIRNERHYQNSLIYIENNPVKAGLCKTPEDWPWSSAAARALGAHASSVPGLSDEEN